MYQSVDMGAGSAVSPRAASRDLGFPGRLAQSTDDKIQEH
jgi:hypothetical protein